MAVGDRPVGRMDFTSNWNFFWTAVSQARRPIGVIMGASPTWSLGVGT